jgi:hypothetical protein
MPKKLYIFSKCKLDHWNRHIVDVEKPHKQLEIPAIQYQ